MNNVYKNMGMTHSKSVLLLKSHYLLNQNHFIKDDVTGGDGGEFSCMYETRHGPHYTVSTEV